MKIKIAILAVLGIVASLNPMFAQTEIEKYKILYPNQPIVQLNSKITLESKVDKTGKIKISETHEEEFIYLGKAASSNAFQKIYYSEAFNTISNIEAHSQSWNGKKYTKYIVGNFDHKEEISDNYFHDDIKFISFRFPELNEGSKSYLKYTIEYKEPYLLHAFYLANGYPIVKTEVQIIENKNTKMGFLEYSFKDERGTPRLSNVKSTQKTNGGKTIYSWIAMNPEMIKNEEKDFNFKYNCPHIIPHLISYTYKDKTTPVLGSVKDLHNWYNTLLQKNKENESLELKNLSDSITRNVTDTLEKVKKIYYWVTKNIKYIAFEAGLEGFVPRPAKDVCRKRFGDCKDMSNLQYYLMKAAGIKGHVVWIGTRDIPYKYSDIPSPTIDNHMIAAYKHKGKYIFLDGTASFNPFSYPSTGILGKEGMVHIDSNEFEIVPVEIPECEKSCYFDSLNIVISGNRLKGNGINLRTGYYGYMARNQLQFLSKQDKKDFLRQALEKGNNRFLLDSFSIVHDQNEEMPLTIQYQMNLDNYIKYNGNELYVNLNLVKPYAEREIDSKRKNGIMENYLGLAKHIHKLTIPEGYSLNYLPKNHTTKNKLFELQINYEIKDNQIIYTSIIKNFTLEIQPSDFEIFNNAINTINQQYNETIVFKKNK